MSPTRRKLIIWVLGIVGVTDVCLALAQNPISFFRIGLGILLMISAFLSWQKLGSEG